MAKALKKIALVVAVVAVAATGVGALVSAGVIAASAATATIATIASIATAVGAIASLGAALLAKPPKQPGSTTQFVFNPDGPMPYAMGRTFVAGFGVHRETWGKDNQYQGFVSVLSAGGPIEALDTFLIDNSAVGLSAGAATGSYNGFMWDSTQLGLAPSPTALQPHSTPGSMPGWGASHKLSGMAADLWVIKFDTKGKKFAGGVPKRGWVGRYVKVYDPRKDSTYPGGSGSHRWNNEATWEYSTNPWLHELTWEIGRRCANVSGQVGAAFLGSLLQLGTGMPIDKIDLPSYVFAANVADANDWEISGVVYSSEDKWTVAKTIALAGGGEPIVLGSKTSAFVQAPRVAAETITSDDLIGPCSIPSDRSFKERYNRIQFKYLSEAHGWEMVPAAPIEVDDWITIDGGPRTSPEQPYRLVPSATQGAQLALYQVADSRERLPIVLALKPRWKGYGPGSCLNLNIPQYGLINQKVIVLDRQEDAGNRAVILSFRTEDDNKHALALAATGIAPPGVDLIPEDMSDIPAPIGGAWAAVGGQLVNAGAQLPAIIITGGTDNPNADQVIFEYRVTGSSEWIMGGTEKADTTRKEISSVAPNEQYDIAISYVVRGVVSAQRTLGPVTVGEQIANDANALGGEPADLVLGSISELQFAANFIQPTPPTVAESVAGNIWLDTTSGIFYQRVGGGISLGGFTITLGGFSPSIYWSAISGQPLLDALINAAAAQATANNALDIAEAATLRLSAIDDDGVLDKGEKASNLKPNDAALESAYQALIASASARGVSFAAATAARSNYLAFRNAISPPWDDITQDSSVSRGSFDSVILAYRSALNALDGAIKTEISGKADLGVANAAAAQAVADAAALAAADAATDATAANLAIDRIVSDGFLDKSEKPAIAQAFAVLANEQAGIDAQAAAFSITTERTAYNAALAALDAYLTGLSPDFDDFTTDTAISRSAFDIAFESTYAARQVLLNKISAVAKARAETAISDAAAAAASAAAAQGTADAAASAASAAASNAATANAAIAKIVSDGFLDKSEKPTIKQAYSVLLNEQSGIDAQAAAFAITSERTAYNAAISALTSYLGGLTPAWDDYATDTAISRSAFDDAFENAYLARQVLLNKIAEIAKARADLGVANSSDNASAISALQSAANFIQDTVPTNAESKIGNIWLNTLTGEFYERVDGTGISLGGFVVTLGGNRPTISWRRITGQPLVDALSKADLAQITADSAIGFANIALEEIDKIGDDDFLTSGEKTQAIVIFEALTENNTALQVKAASRSIAATERTAATTAITTLTTYLNGLSPAWNNLTTDTPISGALFRSYFQAAHEKVALLQAAIQGIIGDRTVAIYRLQYAPPATPTGDNPASWSESPAVGTATRWKATGRKNEAGQLVGVWSTPVEDAQGAAQAYSAGTTFYVRNLCLFNGGTYIALQASSAGNAPTGTDQANAFWGVIAAPGVTGAPAVPPSAFTATINLTSSSGSNLRSIANANGYTGNSDATITFNVPNGVTIRGAAPGGIGINTGTWPTGSYAIALTLVVQSGGIVDGGGGTGGDAGGAGSAGGDAIFAGVAMSGGITINAGGTVRGGGGGGGGGQGQIETPPGQYPNFDDPYNGGGGGGGGAPNGAGGIGELGANGGSDGNNGSAGTTGGGGAAGSGALAAGGGGSFATAGATGQGGGGAAGYAVRKNGNAITVTNSGTMTGTAA